MDKLYDAIIIGGGPAGVSTALYAVRGGLSVALLHNGASALLRAERIENYYGTGATGGAELYETGLEQARAVGAEVISDSVTFAEFDGEMFSVTAVGGVYRARRLVAATGAARARADIDGIGELEGKGVSYCAVCDAFFYRKKRVAVVGAGEFAEHEYNALKAVVGEAYLLTNGEKPSFAAENTVESKIKRVFGENGRFKGVEFADGTTLEADGLFIAIGVFGASALCKSMGVFTDKNGAIITDARGMTNIPGLYAAGDCTAGIKQIGKAVADGIRVGTSIVADIKQARGA
ncbi:MAG: NAD(P)/FAD-dependent oxidoreductase [Roseburia sp.]|nr:NAD(P)/FAD-dependent oxidoreductase [Roseburia sp.]